MPRSGWRYPSYERFKEEQDKGRIVFGDDETTVPAIRYNLFESTTQVERSVIFSYAQTAAQQFDAIFDDVKVFENPKSYADLERIVKYLSDPGDIVMDFFAGSNTTMHGVIRANEGVTPRRCISVQAPERIKRTEKPSAANNALDLGFLTVADLSRARIKRVLASEPVQYSTEGFRAFRLGASNVRRWTGVDDKTPEGYLKQMGAFADTLVSGWKAEDVIWEVALREGYPLTASVAALDAPAKCWRVSDAEAGRAFTICLADAIDFASVKLLGLTKDDLFCCRDTALDDTVAANLALQCRLKVL